MRDVWHPLSYTDHDEFCRDLGCTPLCPPDATTLASLQTQMRDVKASVKRSKRAHARSLREYTAQVTHNGRDIIDGYIALARNGTDTIKFRALRQLQETMAGRDVHDTRVEVEHTGEVEHIGTVVHAHVPVAARPLTAMTVDELETVERALRLLEAPTEVIDVESKAVIDVTAE